MSTRRRVRREFWAETVMSYFDTNIDGPVGGDGAVVDSVFRDAAPLDLCNG